MCADLRFTDLRTSGMHGRMLRLMYCYRYLKHLGYKVRYVRNITDVGHLEDEVEGRRRQDCKKGALEKLEPMEIVRIIY